jgi:hypothetical protein
LLQDVVVTVYILFEDDALTFCVYGLALSCVPQTCAG